MVRRDRRNRNCRLKRQGASAGGSRMSAVETLGRIQTAVGLKPDEGWSASAGKKKQIPRFARDDTTSAPGSCKKPG